MDSDRQRELQRTDDFVQMLTREQRRIQLYIYALVPKWSDAEDIMQNTNMVLWRKCDDFQPNTNFYRWACRVAHFEVLKWRERQVRDAKVFSETLMEEIGEEVAKQGDLVELRHQALRQCLQKLNQRDRQLIMLRYRDGSTTKSVAEELNRPIKSVYAAVYRICNRLLACINRTMAREHATGVRRSPAMEEMG